MKAGLTFRDCPDPWTDDLWPDCYSPYLLRTSASVASSAGNRAFALPLLRRAVALGPGEAWSHGRLSGELLRDMKQFPEARTEFEACVALDPAPLDNWIELFNLLREVGDRDAAQRVLTEGLVHCPTRPISTTSGESSCGLPGIWRRPLLIFILRSDTSPRSRIITLSRP